MSQQQHTINTHANPSLHTLEIQIRQALHNIENATDDDAAALAYTQLKTTLQHYLTQTAQLRDEYHRLKNTIIRQAHAITEHQVEQFLNFQNHNSTHKTDILVKMNLPDLAHVEPPPNLRIIPTSFGFVNLHQIEELHLETQTLRYTSGATRKITNPNDLHKIKYHLNLFTNH